MFESASGTDDETAFSKGLLVSGQFFSSINIDVCSKLTYSKIVQKSRPGTRYYVAGWYIVSSWAQTRVKNALCEV